MSASRERKMRVNYQPAATPEKKKGKLNENLLIFIAVVLILALVFGGLAASKLYWKNTPVITVGNHQVKAAEFNYFYYTQYNNIAQYATSYFGVDSTKSLKEQNVSTSAGMYLALYGFDTSILEEAVNEDNTAYDVTWAQFLADNAKRTAAAYYTVYDQAVSAGFELPAEAVEAIDNEMQTIETYSSMYGYKNANAFVERVYGKGCNAASYRNFVELGQYYTYYNDSVFEGYTDDQIEAAYQADTAHYDMATYYLYQVSGKDFADKDAEVTDEMKEAAKEDAAKMEAAFDTASEDVYMYANYTAESINSQISEEAGKWILSAKAGEVKCFDVTKDDTTTYYVVKVVTNQDYNTMNGYIFYVEKDAEDKAPADGELLYGPKCEKILNAMNSGNIETIEQTAQTLGIEAKAENISYADLSTQADAAVYALDQSRKAGDHTEINTDAGTYFIYYTGAGASMRRLNVATDMINDWLGDLYQTANETAVYNEKAAMHASVSIYG